MEQANPLPNPPTLLQTPINPPIHPLSPNKSVLIILLVIFVLVLVSLNAYLFMKLQNPAQTPLTSPTPIVQISPTPLAPDETANWKTYNGNLFIFKYPLNATLNTITSDPNQQQIDISFWRSGFNSPKAGEMTDGYNFSVLWGKNIGEGTVEEVKKTRLDLIKNIDPQITPAKETVIATKIAYCYEYHSPFLSKECIIGNGKSVYMLQISSVSNEQIQKTQYDLILDQILSTFKFLDKVDNTPSICSTESFGYKIGDYYECQNFNVLYPGKNVMDAPTIITDKNWKEITSCGGMPGPNGPNECPKQYNWDNCLKKSCN